SNGPEALALWEQHPGEIDLLFTDMIMPGGLTGLDLTAQLRKEKPGLKVVLSSGYSAELASAGNLAAHRVTYLPKPSEPGPLAAAVRQCLDQSPPEQTQAAHKE
ncbi:MAG: response regulator, partial [Verrucomicrobia bacterium]|nr:response regulator [Verrucomicrobiota bacterium]